MLTFVCFCFYFSNSSRSFEKLAESLATKTSLILEDRERALRQISLTIETAKAKLTLAQRQYEKRMQKTFSQTLIRINKDLEHAENDERRAIIRRALEQEEIKERQTSEFNEQIVNQHLEQLELTERLIADQLNISTYNTECPAASSNS